jgi:hypothetical protein
MIPLSGNLSPDRGINRREIDSQRHRSIDSGKRVKAEETHSDEIYS